MESEFAGLAVEMMAVAGLLLAVMESGVLALRIVDRVGALKPYDFFRLWYALP